MTFVTLIKLYIDSSMFTLSNLLSNDDLYYILIIVYNILITAIYSHNMLVFCYSTTVSTFLTKCDILQ
jgi:hypothetical protein